MDIYSAPFCSVTEHYRRLELSAGRGNRITKSLVANGLCAAVTINVGGRGGQTKFLSISKRGCEAVDMPPRKHIGRGAGFEHGFWQHRISARLRQICPDCQISVEKTVNGKPVDILVARADSLIAVEIALTPDNEESNMAKDLEVGCARVIAATRREHLDALRHTAAHFNGKVSVCLLTDMLKQDSLPEPSLV
jgi:hypothetical protein